VVLTPPLTAPMAKVAINAAASGVRGVAGPGTGAGFAAMRSEKLAARKSRFFVIGRGAVVVVVSTGAGGASTAGAAISSVGGGAGGAVVVVVGAWVVVVAGAWVVAVIGGLGLGADAARVVGGVVGGGALVPALPLGCRKITAT
jgi:hypothetical protein